MTDLQRIFERIEANRPNMVELQKLLSSIPAVAPESEGDGETAKAEALVGWLRKIGISDIELIEAPDDRVSSGKRPNIIATISGSDDKQRLWIMTHLDVVPPGEESLWETSPFQVVEKDGRLIGRGVEDNQQSMVASIYAAASILEAGLKPAVTVKLLFVADEEVGSEKGIKYLLAHQDPFKRGDLILVPDMGNPQGSVIEIAEKNILWLKFKTSGKQCHASTPQKGINAFVAGSELVLKIDSLNQIYPQRNELFDPPVSTFSPTKKESNIPNVNTIPAEDIFYVDCRILPSIDTDEVLKSIEDFTEEIKKTHGVSIEYTVVNQAESPPTPEDTPLVPALKQAVRAVYGREAKVIGIGGGTVASHLRNAGYDTVVWSTVAETAHMPNEYCVVDSMVGDAEVMAHLMMNG
jgi:succinyl-diaminopimelate desuccinylase